MIRLLLSLLHRDHLNRQKQFRISYFAYFLVFHRELELLRRSICDCSGDIKLAVVHQHFERACKQLATFSRLRMLANILNAITLIADLEKVQLRCNFSRDSRINEIVLNWRLQTKPFGFKISIHFCEGSLEASFVFVHLRAKQIFMFWDF